MIRYLTILVFLFLNFSTRAEILEDLYIFKKATPVEEREFVFAVLTLNRHEKRQDDLSIFEPNRKYVFYFSRNPIKLTVDYEVSLYFGGLDQYAVFLDDSDEPIAGKIGEQTKKDKVEIYVGRRREMNYLDKDAFDTLLETKCSPVQGLRCSNEEPVNKYEDNNIGVIALKIPSQLLTGNSDPSIGKISVWAKAFESK